VTAVEQVVEEEMLDCQTVAVAVVLAGILELAAMVNVLTALEWLLDLGAAVVAAKEKHQTLELEVMWAAELFPLVIIHRLVELQEVVPQGLVVVTYL
jgi:hypothetical protein